MTVDVGVLPRQILSDIADAIRLKDGTSTSMRPTEMANRISAISGGGGSDEKYGYPIDCFLGDPDANGILQVASTTDQIHIDFGNTIDKFADGAVVAKFVGNSQIVSASMPSVTEIGNGGFVSCFRTCQNLTTLSIGALTSIGIEGMNDTFNGCTSLTGSISFASLSSLGASGLMTAFSGCTSLTGSMPFSSLTTVNQESLLECFNGCTSITGTSFPVLQTIATDGMKRTFLGCTSLTGNLTFSALTTIGEYGMNETFK